MTVRWALFFSAAILAPSLAFSAPAVSLQDYNRALAQAESRVESETITPPNAGACEPSEGCVVVDGVRGFLMAVGAQGPAVAAQKMFRSSSTQVRRKPVVVRPGQISADDLKLQFQRGSADLTPDGEARIGAFASALNLPERVSRAFLIVGHTDATGTEERNQGLSEARAIAVKEALVRKGVDAARLETKGLGTREPATSDPFAAANRRVEVRAAG